MLVALGECGARCVLLLGYRQELFFPPLLIMPSRSRTEASAAGAIYSSYVAATWLIHKELPFKALEASFFDATLHPINFLSRALQGVGQSNPYKTLYVLGPCFLRAR